MISQEEQRVEIRRSKRVAGLPVAAWLMIFVTALAAFGFWMYERARTPKPAIAQTITYTCPMHRQIHSDKPGKCPICGMDLVPETTLDTRANTLAAPTVMLSAEEAVRANVGTEFVREEDFTSSIDAIGVLQIAEPNERTITARARGRIDRLYVAATGGFIAAGQPLYEFYSPDLLNAEQEYLIALHAGHTHAGDHAHVSSSLAEAGRTRLALLGLTESQIQSLEASDRPGSEIIVRAPQSGFVTQKLTQVGSYVDEGTPLFQLADLSSVWAVIDIPEAQIRFLRLGQPVTIESEAYPGSEFIGKVIFISPVEDAATRTIQVRALLANPGQKLRPQMAIRAHVDVPAGRSLSVPASAVVRTGTNDFVWVRDSSGSFLRRTVTLGIRSPQDRYQILSGLVLGEQVAVSGTFLIDAEHELTTSSTSRAAESSARTPAQITAQGVIRSVDPAAQTIAIDHGPIEGIQEVGVTLFHVSNAGLLREAAIGRKVQFTLSRATGAGYVLTAIARI